MRATIATLSLLALSTAVVVPVHSAESVEVEQDFSIAAQPLPQALREYARQSGDQVVFYSALGRGRESAAVQGRYTRQQALRKLLENSGLDYRRLNSRTVAIRAVRARKQNSRQSTSAVTPLRLAPPNEPALAASGGANRGTASQASRGTLLDVEEVIVTGTAVAGRTKFASSVAISTFDADEIAQRAPLSSADLIGAVPGFWVESTSGSTHGNVFARGIVQDGGYRYVGLMEDGIPLYPLFELSFYNPDQFVRIDATVERVEALRGGTAPIFTAGAVGGSINFVTRTPTAAPRGILKAGLGDYGLHRADLSWTGPLGDAGGLALGGYYRRADGVRDPGYPADAGGQLRVKLAHSFAQGELELFAKHIDDRSLFSVPIPLTGSASNPRGLLGADAGTYTLHSEDLARAPLPPSATQVGLRDSNLEDGIHPQLTTLGARLVWQLNDAASFTNLSRYTSGDVRFDGIFPGDPPTSGAAFAYERGVAPDYRVLSSGTPYAATQLVQHHGHWVVNKRYQALQDDLRLNLSLGDHALTTGLYLADYSMADRWSLGNTLLMNVSDRPRRLLLAGVTDPSGYTRYATFNLIADYQARAYSLYAADEWQLSDALRIDAGLRVDSQSVAGSISEARDVDLDGDAATPWDNATSQAGPGRTALDRDFDNFAWSLGFNYRLPARHALFAHYTRAAKLPGFDDLRNDQARKDTVSNLELGYKVAHQRLVVFATLFQTEFDNVSFADIDAGGEPRRRQAGTRTRGLELEGAIEALAALNIRFSLTWQDPQYTGFSGATLDNTGNQVRRIPKLMGRITPSYAFRGGRLKLFMTLSHVGARFANDENTITLPAYRKLDAGVTLDLDRGWTLQLSGDNLTDAVGLTEGNPRTDVEARGIGAIYLARPLFGRSFLGSLTYRY